MLDGCRLSDGFIALVVVIVLLVSAIIVIVLAVFIARRLRHIAKLEELALTAPAQVWQVNSYFYFVCLFLK